MFSKLFQVNPEVHALLNNEAFVLSPFKLNLGFWLILDVQLLPLPRIWLRIPFVGEIAVGFMQYEVCSDGTIPDFIGFEVNTRKWVEVEVISKKLWEDIRDPGLLSVCGSPEPNTLENLIAWGIGIEDAERLCEEAGDAPFIMIRGISNRIDSNRYF